MRAPGGGRKRSQESAGSRPGEQRACLRPAQAFALRGVPTPRESWGQGRRGDRGDRRKASANDDEGLA